MKKLVDLLSRVQPNPDGVGIEIEVEGRGGHHLGGWVTLPDAILELNYSILGVKS